ncbi:MAG: RNase adapter RapZ [Actinobacteria bacterium]|nr:MAG: RNase adapter RapZ [Actinomycetota bacterium]
MAATHPADADPDVPGEPQSEPRLQDLVVITGFSGAGKSTAMQVFEDAGYFCVDNLPPEMIRGLVELLAHPGSKVERAAVVSDVRGGELFDALVDVLDALEDSGIHHRVLFLDADEETLLTRYKETRRRHPLSPAGTVPTGIAAERAVLDPLKAAADLVIDTAGLSARGLRRRIADELLPRHITGRMAVTFQSFGFKHGPPRDADLVFDVRFLPNPHYVHHLRLLTGHDQRVIDYVGREGKLDAFYEHVMPLLDFVLPEYVAEGKAHLTVAIGCTGGRHRSVCIAEELARRFAGRDHLHVDVAHRDVDKAPKGP